MKGVPDVEQIEDDPGPIRDGRAEGSIPPSCEGGYRQHQHANDQPDLRPAWSIQMVAPDRLKKSPRNARVHPKKQIGQIVNSIHAFGYTNPPLVDEHDKIIGGHARVEAAQRAGLKKIPAIVISGLSEVKKRALALANNRMPKTLAGTGHSLHTSLVNWGRFFWKPASILT